MKNNNKMKKPILGLAVFAFLVLGANAAQATPLTLTLESGPNAASLGLLWTVEDGGAGDLDGAVNDSITVQHLFDNGLDVFFSVGASAPLAGDLARLTLNTVHMQNSGEGSVRATLTKGGLGGGYTGDATAVGNFWGQLQASAGSTVSAQSWVDSTALYDPDVVHTATVGGPEEFTYFDIANLNLARDFTLMTQISLNFAPGGGILSVTDANVEVLPVSSVPEPGSLLLFGSGLLGLATVVRRKNKKRSA